MTDLPTERIQALLSAWPDGETWRYDEAEDAVVDGDGLYVEPDGAEGRLMALAPDLARSVIHHADRYTILTDSIRDGLAGVDGAASIADEDLADVVAAQVERAEMLANDLALSEFRLKTVQQGAANYARRIDDLSRDLAAQVERADRAEQERDEALRDLARSVIHHDAEVRAEPAPATIRDLKLGAITPPPFPLRPDDDGEEGPW